MAVSRLRYRNYFWMRRNKIMKKVHCMSECADSHRKTVNLPSGTFGDINVMGYLCFCLLCPLCPSVLFHSAEALRTERNNRKADDKFSSAN